MLASFSPRLSPCGSQGDHHQLPPSYWFSNPRREEPSVSQWFPQKPQMNFDWTRLSHMASSQHQCSQKVASSAQPRSNGYLPHSDLLPGSRGGVVHQRKTGHWDPKAKDVMSPGHWETKAEDVLRKSCQSSCLDGGEDSDKRVPDGVIFELN